MAGEAAAAPVAPLRHDGRWIVDAKGRVVILHGFNMVNKLPPYHPAALGFGNDDVAFLGREGFNTVRLGIVYKGLEPTRGQYDDAYLDRVRSTARKLQRAGIFPLVDFHQDMYNERYNGEGFPDWAAFDDGLPPEPDQGFPVNYLIMPALQRAYDHFWANDRAAADGVSLQDAYAAAWRHVAERFRGERALLGYDIFNEPFPGTDWQTCANPDGCPAADERLSAFSKRVFAAIRQADRRNLLWYEPYLTFNNGADTHHADTGDARAGMSFHLYCLSETPGVADSGDQTGACDTSDDLTYENAKKQSEETGGDALILSEFGATDTLETIERVIEHADDHQMSWQYWSYWNEDVCCPRPVEGVVNDVRMPPTGSNVKREKLAVLARAYPRAVAGTPESYDFDRDTFVFDLAYRVKRPDGGAVRPGRETEIFLPRRHYKGRYDVRVTGGRVVSKRGKTVLRIVALPGAERVTVHVTPR